MSRPTAGPNLHGNITKTTPKPLVIVQHNINYKPNFIENLLLHEDVDIWLIQEPPNPLPISIPNYQLIHHPPQPATPKKNRISALTIVKSNIKIKYINSSYYHTHIKLLTTKIHVVNFYLSPSHPPPHYIDTFQSLLHNSKILICGDFNAHHTSLGDRNDLRGVKIYDLTQPLFSLLNKPDIKTWSARTTPDWSLSSNQLAPYCHWSTDTDLINSDHLLIKITVDIPTTRETKKYVHFPTFYNKVLPLQPDQVTDVSDLPRLISDAAVSSIKTTANFSKTGYWDSSLQDLKDSIQKLKSKLPFLYGPSLVTASTTLRNLNQKYKLQIKKKRTTDFLNTIADNNLSNIQKKLLKTRKTAAPITSLSIDGDIILNQDEINHILINSFFPPKTVLPLSLPPLPQSSFSTLSTKEIQMAIKYIKNVTPGYDKLNAHAIKIWFKISPNLLLFLFKSLFSQCLFPTSLGLTVIYPIPKIQTTHPTPLTLRPIGVRPILCKTYEYIINYRLKHHLVTNNLLPSYQYGFTPGKSCTTLLNDLTHSLVNTTDECILISVDIKGAFSNISHQSVIDSMLRLNFPSQLIILIAQFLSNCQMTILNENQYPTVNKILTYGCPQGSGLSPTVFNLSLDHALHPLIALHTSNVKIFAYADDINLLFSFEPGQRTSLINTLVNTTLTHLQEHLLLSGLEISPSKTRALSFLSPHRTNYLKLKLNNQPINFVDNLSLLGLNFNKHLDFSPHVLQKIKQCHDTLPKLKNILKMNSKVKHQTKLLLIESHVYSKLFYASSAWLSTQLKPTALNRLLSLQAHTSKICHSLPFHTSNYKSIALLNQPPLIFLCHQKANIQNYNEFHPNLNLHFDIPKLPLLSFPPSLFDSILFGSDIKTQDDMNNLSADYFIFTDASLFPYTKSVSASYVILDQNQYIITCRSWSLPSYANIYQAEASAITQALTDINDLIHSNDVIRLVSDSKSVLASLSSLNHKNARIHDILDRLLLLLPTNTLYFHWCKAHSNVRGNELADSLANFTALHLPFPDTHEIPAPRKILTDYEKNLTLYKSQENYSKHLSTTSLLHQLLPTYNHPNLNILGHHPSVAIIITESNFFLSKMKQINKSLTDKCPCSYGNNPVIQTAIHCLTNCPLIHNNKKIRKSWRSLALHINPDVNSLLANQNFLTFISRNSSLILNLLMTANQFSLNFKNEFTKTLPELELWLTESRLFETESAVTNLIHDHNYYIPMRKRTAAFDHDHTYFKRHKSDP